MDFKDLRNTIQVSDSVLSKQLSTLEKAGFIEIRKAFVGKFPRTSVKLTPEGHQAWEHHMATLRLIAGGYRHPARRHSCDTIEHFCRFSTKELSCTRIISMMSE
ncbi:winged helix-turn-helix domain-containing protein [Arthrobacter sp. HLT1-20]